MHGELHAAPACTMMTYMNASSSSIRVSAHTRKRVGDLARRMRAASQQEVIERALDRLERQLFWEGFDEEASAYLNSYPGERAERDKYGRISGDGLRRQG
jgi:predicted transcriptional regulator